MLRRVWKVKGRSRQPGSLILAETLDARAQKVLASANDRRFGN